MTRPKLVASRNKAGAKGAAMIISGINIKAVIINNTSGNAMILSATGKRRCKTSSRAERKALSGVMSGKVDIYSAKSEEVSI